MTAAPDESLPAVQVRIALDRVLAEHAFLIIEAMLTAPDGGAEHEVTASVLVDNTDELVELVDTPMAPMPPTPSPSSGGTTSRSSSTTPGPWPKETTARATWRRASCRLHGGHVVQPALEQVLDRQLRVALDPKRGAPQRLVASGGRLSGVGPPGFR